MPLSVVQAAPADEAMATELRWQAEQAHSRLGMLQVLDSEMKLRQAPFYVKTLKSLKRVKLQGEDAPGKKTASVDVDGTLRADIAEANAAVHSAGRNGCRAAVAADMFGRTASGLKLPDGTLLVARRLDDGRHRDRRCSYHPLLRVGPPCFVLVQAPAGCWMDLDRSLP